jgi:hypothetical protein
MRPLLNDEFAPITSEFGLVHAECDAIAKWWVRRDGEIHAKRGVSVACTSVSGGLRTLLSRLSPLTSVERRRVLLMSTSSNWTAVFDNGWQGGDAAGLSVAALDLRCQAVRVVAISDPRRYGARIFELYGPEQTEFLNYIRTISVANDGGKWRFDQSGRPLEVEDASWFTSRSVKNRFQDEHLSLLLKRLGLKPFEENFYGSEGRLIERHGPTVPECKEFQISDVQAQWKL